MIIGCRLGVHIYLLSSVAFILVFRFDIIVLLFYDVIVHSKYVHEFNVEQGSKVKTLKEYCHKTVMILCTQELPEEQNCEKSENQNYRAEEF